VRALMGIFYFCKGIVRKTKEQRNFSTRKKEDMMARKIAVLCILCCFTSGTLYAQTISFEQRTVSVQIAGTSIMEKLDALIDQLDRGIMIRPGDIDDIINEFQSIDNDIREMAAALKNTQSADKDTVCGMIQWISLAWLGIGASSLMSLLGPIVSIIIKQSTPEQSTLDTINLARQYLRLARKVLVTAVIVPVSLINSLLASRQYRDCMNADF
jgi:hypothetical protein